MENDVLREEIKGLRELIELRFDHTREALDSIKVQTTKTNGRVNKLETWRTYLTGAMAVLLFLITLGIIKINKLF